MINICLASDSGELILSYLTDNHALHRIVNLNYGNKKMFPLALRYFALKTEVSNGHTGFSEDLNKSTENTKHKVVNIFSK